MKPLLLITILLAATLSAEAQPRPGGFIGGGGAGGGSEIKGSTVFWDDFENVSLSGSNAFINRLSPSGHKYRIFGANMAGPEGLVIANGMLKQTAGQNDAAYIQVSPRDGHDNGYAYFTRIGMTFRLEHVYSNPAGFGSATLFWNDRPGDLLGNFSHTAFTTFYTHIFFHRKLTTDYLIHYEPIFRRLTNELNYIELSVVTNTYGSGATYVIDFNGSLYVGSHTNAAALGPLEYALFEITNADTNFQKAAIESIWAGYADPALVASIRPQGSSRDINGGGVWTNSLLDTAVTFHGDNLDGFTNYLVIAETVPGKQIVIRNDQSDVGTFSVRVVNGAKIDGGHTQTNIAAGASRRFEAKRTGWKVIGTD